MIFNLDRFQINNYSEASSNFLAIRYISNMKQLMDPEQFVCSEYAVQDCYSLPNEVEKPKLHVCQQNLVNRSRDFFLQIRHVTKAKDWNNEERI